MTGKFREERITNAESANVTRPDIANFGSPASPQFSLKCQVELLGVWRVSVDGCGRKRREVDHAVGSCAAVIKAGLPSLIDEDGTNVRIVCIQRSARRDKAQAGKSCPLGNKRRRDCAE